MTKEVCSNVLNCTPFLVGHKNCFFYAATQLFVAAHEYLIAGYPCWKTVLELLGSTTVTGTVKHYQLTIQQLLTAFYRSKLNETQRHLYMLMTSQQIGQDRKIL
jgi:hypothetical protein